LPVDSRASRDLHIVGPRPGARNGVNLTMQGKFIIRSRNIHAHVKLRVAEHLEDTRFVVAVVA
jgi:hypothetical protein